jgi:plastocyanin
VAALLAVPAVAGAATRVVYAGPPPQGNAVALKILGKTFINTYSPDGDAFYQQKITIAAGDKITFIRDGFHSADFPGKSGKDLPLFITGGTNGTINDFGGTPFWFSGKTPVVMFNPALFAPSGGNVYNGTKRVDTGIPGGSGAPKPVTIAFTKPGKYKYFCDVHPGMIGWVVVKPKGSKIPSAAQDKAAQTKQITADIKAAKPAVAQKVPVAHVSVGKADGKGGELLAMFPATQTVKAGTVVTFSLAKGSREVHTVTFGTKSYLTMLAKGFGANTKATQISSYPSDQGKVLTLTPTSHGNGFINLGALDNDPGTPGGPSGQIDFSTPGTYHFICLIHPFMHGTIIVTP